ncbi:MAG: hypothetical protein N7Q72_04785, partial [Spiroplasma sp. Tabriz.8]|nr:hypothetical protein [Spiroplasma sp. Tabriz.8]
IKSTHYWLFIYFIRTCDETLILLYVQCLTNLTFHAFSQKKEKEKEKEKVFDVYVQLGVRYWSN